MKRVDISRLLSISTLRVVLMVLPGKIVTENH